MSKRVLIIIIFVLFIGGEGAYILSHQPSIQNQVIVEMTALGFSPERITIQKGNVVQWFNTKEEYRWPASNLHPTHELYSEFDPQEPIAPNESWSFTFKKKGTWSYHDHLRPYLQGVIEVVE